MGWVCGMYGGQHKCVHTFDREPRRKRSLEDLRHIWLDITVHFKWDEGVDWSSPALGRDRWQTLVT